jgi:hypothetical protein
MVDGRSLPEGTVLLVGVTFSGMTSSAEVPAKVYTHAMLKAGGSWYVTGGGAPQMAGWGAIERWLSRDGRQVVWVKKVTASETIEARGPADRIDLASPE